VNKINGLEADIVKQNFNSCFSINEEFTVTWEISCVLAGEDLADSEDLKDVSAGEIVCYKYDRLESCDVEHTFSQYKSFFHDKWHRFAILGHYSQKSEFCRSVTKVSIVMQWCVKIYFCGNEYAHKSIGALVHDEAMWGQQNLKPKLSKHGNIRESLSYWRL
jgi:hypothetical protein